MGDLNYAGLHHVKFPVADLEESLRWYETVMLARHDPRFDHRDAEGLLFAVITFWPGVDVPCELRLAPRAAHATAGYDPVTFGVADERALLAWTEHFDSVGADHSGVVDGYAGKLVQLSTPDGLVIRLYTVAPGGGLVDAELRIPEADRAHATLSTSLMEPK